MTNLHRPGLQESSELILLLFPTASAILLYTYLSESLPHSEPSELVLLLLFPKVSLCTPTMAVRRSTPA